jgi:hypothetical protein
MAAVLFSYPLYYSRAARATRGHYHALLYCEAPHYLLASRFSRPDSQASESASLPSSSASAYICFSSSPVDLPCHSARGRGCTPTIHRRGG